MLKVKKWLIMLKINNYTIYRISVNTRLLERDACSFCIHMLQVLLMPHDTRYICVISTQRDRVWRTYSMKRAQCSRPLTLQDYSVRRAQCSRPLSHTVCSEMFRNDVEPESCERWILGTIYIYIYTPAPYIYI